MHLSGGRSLHEFPSLNCYYTSLHPRAAGLKSRTSSCSSNNTSLSALLKLAHLRHSWAWPTAPSRLNTTPMMTQLAMLRQISVLPGPEEIYHQFEDEPEATSKPYAPSEAINSAPAPVAAAPVVCRPSRCHCQHRVCLDSPPEELGAALGSGHSGDLQGNPRRH